MHYYYYYYYYYYACYHSYAGYVQCNYTMETSHVSTVYSVAVVLYLRLVLHAMLFRMSNVLYFDISTFRSLCAVPIRQFFLCFLHLVLSRCIAQVLSDFDPVAPINTGILLLLLLNLYDNLSL